MEVALDNSLHSCSSDTSLNLPTWSRPELQLKTPPAKANAQLTHKPETPDTGPGHLRGQRHSPPLRAGLTSVLWVLDSKPAVVVAALAGLVFYVLYVTTSCFPVSQGRRY